MSYCAECGAEHDHDDDFCTSCGTPLSGDTASSDPDSKNFNEDELVTPVEARKARLYIIAGGALALISLFFPWRTLYANDVLVTTQAGTDISASITPVYSAAFGIVAAIDSFSTESYVHAFNIILGLAIVVIGITFTIWPSFGTTAPQLDPTRYQRGFGSITTMLAGVLIIRGSLNQYILSRES